MNIFFKPVLKKIAELNKKRLCPIALEALFLLSFSAFFNLDLSQKQGLSINAMTFGKYPPLFLVSGISGSILVLAIAQMMRKIDNRLVLTISNGTIVILGFHELIYFGFEGLVKTYNPLFAIFFAAFVLGICTVVISFCSRYFPILLGNRAIK